MSTENNLEMNVDNNTVKNEENNAENNPEIKEEVEIEKALNSLTDTNISIHQFDLIENTFQLIKSNKFIDILAEAYADMQDKLNNVMKNITAPEQIEQVLEFSNLSTLSERMGQEDEISIDFLGKINGWCRAKFLVLQRDEEDGSITQVLHTVEYIPADTEN